MAGRPNVGKSTLINRLLGQKIAAVSPKPQTTRLVQLGILTTEDAQVIFMDTPGMHEPQHKLGTGMNALASDALEEADVILWLVDASQLPHAEDGLIARRISGLPGSTPAIQGLNKVDLLPAGQLGERAAAYQQLLPRAEQLPFSALAGSNLDALMVRIIALLPESPPQFPPDQVTDLYERDIAADLIREAALDLLHDEVPHALAVRMDEYTERGEQGAYIAATLFVERESQKGIVIGKGGEMLKAIGTAARRAIEAMSGRKVFLELRVKVNKNWRSNPAVLSQMGFPEPGEG